MINVEHMDELQERWLEYISVEYIKDRVRRVKELSWDWDAARSEEDDLLRKTMWAISRGTVNNPRELATEALKSMEIDFARWTG